MRFIPGRKQWIRTLILGLLLCMMTGTAAQAAAWVKTSYGYRYFLDSRTYVKGWQKINGKWYYFNRYGVRAEGLMKLNDNLYAFQPGTGVRVENSWVLIDGKYYYADKNGMVQKNRWIQDRYVISTGQMGTGWLTLGGQKYYLNTASGRKTVGKMRIDGKWYFFDENGCMVTEKWQKIDGSLYYFKADGTMAISEWVGQYYVGANGVKSDTIRAKGLVNVNGKYYFVNDDYTKAQGWKTLNGKTYYFGDTGSAAYVGLKNIGGELYYFDSTGAMVTGWMTINNHDYYFDEKGVLVRGRTVMIDGRAYTFNANGLWANTERGKEIARTALRYVGGPYVYGGNDLLNGVDCSGFTQQIMKLFDISIPRTADDQRLGSDGWGTYTKSRVIKPVLTTMLPGDLIFYGYSPNYATHVAMYIGNGKIVHASTSETGIIISDYDYGTPIIGVRRYW